MTSLLLLLLHAILSGNDFVIIAVLSVSCKALSLCVPQICRFGLRLCDQQKISGYHCGCTDSASKYAGFLDVMPSRCTNITPIYTCIYLLQENARKLVLVRVHRFINMFLCSLLYEFEHHTCIAIMYHTISHILKDFS